MGLLHAVGRLLGRHDSAQNPIGIKPGQTGTEIPLEELMKDKVIASLLKPESTAAVQDPGQPFDLAHHRFGVEIEVAAPRGIDNPNPPPTAKEIKKLIDKGYTFTVDGSLERDNENHPVIQGGTAEKDPGRILQIVSADPSRIIATDPNTGEHHSFVDTENPKVNLNFFYQYVKFKSFMEDQVRPAMDKIGWMAEDTVDCQAHAGVAEAIRYIEVKCKNPITMAEGGREQVARALDFLKEIGCTVHPACALQYHIDLSKMSRDDAMKTMQNLLKLELENENILYRVAQNGDSAHRGVENGFLFCRSLATQPVTPLLHAKDPEEMKQIWYNTLFPGGEWSEDPKERPDGPYHQSRYYGLNFHSYWYRGSVEFRYFNTTLDPETALAHLDLCLGMVKTAATRDVAWRGIHPLGWDPPTDSHESFQRYRRAFQVGNGGPVSKDQLQRFLDQTFGDSPSRQKILYFFVKGGGKAVDIPEQDPDLEKMAGLMEKGYTTVTHSPELGGMIIPPGDAVEAVESIRKMNGAKKANYVLEVRPPGASRGIMIDGPDALHEFLIAPGQSN